MTVPLSNNELDRLVIDVDARQGEKMIQSAYDFLGRFLSYPSEHAHVAHVLWCVHTHLMDKWESTPRLAFLSAEKESGKTGCLEITELLVPRPMMAVNMSPSALFRSVGSEDGLPTILFDEIDTVFGPKAKENEEIRGLLNAGHRRGAKTYRSVIRGKSVEVEPLEAFCAVALAGLGYLPDTISSRAIIIRMRRRHAGERVEPYRRRIHGIEGNQIKELIAVWARSAVVEWPELPNEIQDRNADVWEPIIAVADAIGGKWPALVRQAGIALIAEGREADTSMGVRLLIDTKTVFESADQLWSKTILARLVELPESPWADIYGKPLDERGLAKRLRGYGIKPKSIRMGPETARGYSRADFVDVWRRYVEPPENANTSNTTNTLPKKQVSDVSDVLLFPGMGDKRQRCVHCNKQAGETVEAHYGAAVVWLHRGCMDAWREAYDALGIPPFLDRRGELQQ
jgi:hypothetical protein